MPCKAGAGAPATPAAAGASLARRHLLRCSHAAWSSQPHRARPAAHSSWFQHQVAPSCAAAHLHGKHLAVPWQQHCQHHQQQHRSSVVAAAAAAGAAGQSDADSSGSWFTKVVLPTALVLLVCNMDRICLSVAILPMAQEYGWPATVQVRHSDKTARAAVTQQQQEEEADCPQLHTISCSASCCWTHVARRLLRASRARTIK